MYMEPDSPAETPAPASPAPAKPVMDVMPPPRPIEGVHTPPPPPAPEPHDQEESVELKKDEPKADKPAAKPKAPKQPHSGLGLIVFATVIIVLGLGAMVTYAYLRTQGISVF